MAFAEYETVVIGIFRMIQIVSERAAKHEAGHQFRCRQG